MLSGIYYGAQYGGSTTAILMNIPGKSTSVVTAIDGYRMAQQGRASEALAIAAIGSFIAGCVGSLVVALAGPPLARIAQKFESPDYFSLMVLGLVSAVVLASGSVFRAVAMILLGLLLGLVGADINSGMQRMTFDLFQLSDGLSFIALAMGLFGVAEVVSNLEIEVAADHAVRVGSWRVAVAAGIAGGKVRDPARHADRHRVRRPAGRRSDRGGVCVVCHRETRRIRPVALWQGRDRRRRGPGSRRTTRPRRPRSCRSSRWAFPPAPPWR